jgi:uncharacterized membrane protein YbhN (UPF0104 family)
MQRADRRSPSDAAAAPVRAARQPARARVARVARLLVTVVVIVMIVLFARRIEWSVTWAAIRSANVVVLLLATVINLGSAATKAFRWWIFLRAAGSRSLGLALRATFAGLGLNNILVASGGEAARVIFVARTAHLPSATVLATVALERLFELIGYVVLLSLSAILLDLPPALARTRPFALAALVGIAVLLVYLVRRPSIAAELAAELAEPPPSGFCDVPATTVRVFSPHSEVFRRDRGSRLLSPCRLPAGCCRSPRTN